MILALLFYLSHLLAGWITYSTLCAPQYIYNWGNKCKALGCCDNSLKKIFLLLLSQGLILAATTLPLLVFAPVIGNHSRNEFYTHLCASALCGLAYSKLRVLPCTQLCTMRISVSLKDFSAALPFPAKVFHSLDHEGML